MTLSATIAAVDAAVLAEVPTCTFGVGWRVADDQGSPPRVRWLPLADEPGAAPKLSPLATGLQRALCAMPTTFDVECWGEDFEAAVSLRDALVRALHSAAGPSVYAIGAGRWAQGDALTLGESTTLRVTLRAYVPETAPTVATVTTVTPNTSDAADGDGEVFVPSDTP